MDTEVVPVWGGLVLEFFGALFLVLTVLATTNAARGHSPGFLQPLSIGFAVFCSVSFMVGLTFLPRSKYKNFMQAQILSREFPDEIFWRFAPCFTCSLLWAESV